MENETSGAEIAEQTAIESAAMAGADAGKIYQAFYDALPVGAGTEQPDGLLEWWGIVGWLACNPANWSQLKAAVEAKAAASRLMKFARARPAASFAGAVRAAQDAFPGWTAMRVCDANEHGLFVSLAESRLPTVDSGKRAFVVQGAGGEWICQFGDKTVAIPAGEI